MVKIIKVDQGEELGNDDSGLDNLNMKGEGEHNRQEIRIRSLTWQGERLHENPDDERRLEKAMHKPKGVNTGTNKYTKWKAKSSRDPDQQIERLEVRG